MKDTVLQSLIFSVMNYGRKKFKTLSDISCAVCVHPYMYRLVADAFSEVVFVLIFKSFHLF